MKISAISEHSPLAGTHIGDYRVGTGFSRATVPMTY